MSRVFIMAVVWLLSFQVHASLENVLSDLGTNWNVTKGGAFDSQAAGFVTGGSLHARNQMKNYNLIDVRPPSFNAGCGGIDAHLGSLGFIKAEELLRALKQIPSNMTGYAFQLALQTQSPQIYNIVNELFAWAQKANSMSINSCETAQMLVGGMWSQFNMSGEHACKSMAAGSGNNHDWFDARKSCGNNRASSVEKAKEFEQFKDQLGEEFNLTWEALKKNNLFAAQNINDVLIANKKDKTINGQQFKELFMSVSGSIISRPWVNADKKQNRHDSQKIMLPSLVNDEKFLDMLLFGGDNGIIYVCDNSDKCLYPTTTKRSIKSSDALASKISLLLDSLKTKAITDSEGATAAEKSLIESTAIPILKIISVQAAFKEGTEQISNVEVSEVIAWDILMSFLEDITSKVEESLLHLESVQINGEYIAKMKDNIYKVRRLIATKRQTVHMRMLTVMNLVDSLMQQDQYLKHNIANFSSLGEGGNSG